MAKKKKIPTISSTQPSSFSFHLLKLSSSYIQKENEGNTQRKDKCVRQEMQEQ
jgi:hypothetical protein